jgi:ketosteroid isomerase-like protein
MDIFERVRRGYRALGFGADADVLAMLDQDGPEPACWEIHSLDVRRVRSRPAREVAALDLFGGFPAQYELIGVQVRSWAPNERRQRLGVVGTYRLRLRGTAETLDIPFSHFWSFNDGRVKEVRNLTEGYELRRRPAAASSAA